MPSTHAASPRRRPEAPDRKCLRRGKSPVDVAGTPRRHSRGLVAQVDRIVERGIRIHLAQAVDQIPHHVQHGDEDLGPLRQSPLEGGQGGDGVGEPRQLRLPRRIRRNKLSAFQVYFFSISLRWGTVFVGMETPGG